MVRFLGSFVLAIAMMPGVASALTRCGDVSVDGAQMGAVRESITAACPCSPGLAADRTAHLKCANGVIADAVERGLVRSECRNVLRDGVNRSTCGRPAGATVCCAERSSGDSSCRIARDADACVSTATRRAWLGSTESCFDGCRETCQAASDCDDGDACTTDTCDEVLGCSHAPIPNCVEEAPSGVNCSGTAASTWELDREEVDLLALINAERRRRGAPALKACRSLSKAAQKHSADMRDRNYFSHTGKNGSTFYERICDAGYEQCETVSVLAEVITADRGGAAGAFEDWMNSSSHRSIMLHSWMRAGGLGYACGGYYGGYWTLDLAGADDPSCD